MVGVLENPLGVMDNIGGDIAEPDAKSGTTMGLAHLDVVVELDAK